MSRKYDKNPSRFAALYRPHRLAWPRTLPFQGSNTGSNPVGDTSTYARPTNSCDTGVTRRSVDNSPICQLTDLPILQRLDPSPEMTWRQMGIPERHRDIAVPGQRRDFRQWPSRLH